MQERWEDNFDESRAFVDCLVPLLLELCLGVEIVKYGDVHKQKLGETGERVWFQNRGIVAQEEWENIYLCAKKLKGGSRPSLVLKMIAEMFVI